MGASIVYRNVTCERVFSEKRYTSSSIAYEMVIIRLTFSRSVPGHIVDYVHRKWPTILLTMNHAETVVLVTANLKSQYRDNVLSDVKLIKSVAALKLTQRMPQAHYTVLYTMRLDVSTHAGSLGVHVDTGTSKQWFFSLNWFIKCTVNHTHMLTHVHRRGGTSSFCMVDVCITIKGENAQGANCSQWDLVDEEWMRSSKWLPCLASVRASGDTHI